MVGNSRFGSFPIHGFVGDCVVVLVATSQDGIGVVRPNPAINFNRHDGLWWRMVLGSKSN